MLDKKTLNFNFYQAANETDCEIIKQNFIVRTKDFNLIRSDLINDDMQGSVQHFLILGRRGSGKSTLLKRIECEIESNKKLLKKFVVINLAEEQGGIHRLFDLWEEVIRALKEDRYENLPNTDEIDIPEDYGEYSKQLFSYIQDVVRAKKKKLLLLIDNIDKIFLGFKNDAQILRETLLNFDDIKIIGCSTKMSEHFWQYDMPFYQFFRVLRLEALSRKDIEKLLMYWSELLQEKEIENFIINNPGQLETIRILTDGLPRTLQFFIDLLINRPQQNGYSYIKKIMDRMTPLYQERLGSLQAVEQKIVMKLAFFWEAVNVKDLVKPTKIESKLLSANLKKLSDIGIVEKIATGKKNHLYRLSERFFNMWLIVTQGNPAEKIKARWLTVFLENWYNKQEIKNLIHTHLIDLKAGTKDADHLSMFTKSLAQSKYTSLTERDLLIDETLKLETISPHLKDTLPEKSFEIFNKIEKLIGKENYDDALYHTNKILNEVDGVKEDTVAYIHIKKEDFSSAEEYYKKAIEKGYVGALFNLAHLYNNQYKLELAEKYYKKAVEKNHIKALHNLILLYYIKASNKNELKTLIKQLKTKDEKTKGLSIIVRLWLGELKGIYEDVKELSKKDNTINGFFIEHLLIHRQINLVWQLFNEPETGQQLIDKFKPLFYASSLMLNNEESTKTLLKIPPEIKDTVDDIINKIEEQRKLYYKED